MHKYLKIMLAALLGTVIITLVVATALAQGSLQFFRPREVQQIPAAMQQPPPPAQPSAAQIAEAFRSEDFADIEKAAGFTLLFPKDLPAGCKLRSHSFDTLTHAANLKYTCVTISEKRGQRLEQPYAGPNSVQSITVQGQPAILVDGSWVTMPGDKEPKWRQGFVPTLVFERDGIVVRLVMLGDDKEGLIKIAESMQ